MTAPSTAVQLVHTSDSSPDAAPYRISAKPGFDTATATIEVDIGQGRLVPGAGLRPGSGVRPSSGVFDVGAAVVGGDLTPGMVPYVGAIVMTTGNNPGAKSIAALGVVCGITRCGSEGAKPLRVEARRVYAGGLRFVAHVLMGTITWGEIQGADRSVPVNVFTLIEPEGWV